ncbi:hypothetical protein Tco_1374649 [Tanacetum coccineum]
MPSRAYPLAMPSGPPHGGGFRKRVHEASRAKGRWPRYPHLRSDEWRTDRPGFSRALAGSGVPVKGASAYPGVIITTCTSNLGTVERPYKHYWQRPSGENAAGAKRGRPAPGEHWGEKEPGQWKSQGRPGHLTEMEGFGL